MKETLTEQLLKAAATAGAAQGAVLDFHPAVESPAQNPGATEAGKAL